jgi:hypothetical protein
MGVPIHGEPQPDDGWMYSLLLLRIHRARPSAATAVVGRWAIGLILPRCEAWLLNALYSSCTLGAPLLRRGSGNLPKAPSVRDVEVCFRIVRYVLQSFHRN